MTRFSNDVDILKCEPVLFGEMHLPGQVLASGTGAALSGTTLTAAGADFGAACVEVGGVIHLQSADDSLDGAYEIVSVNSATELTISVIRSEAAAPAVAPPAAQDVSYRVSTFAPQAEDVAFELTQCFGIQPGNPTSEITVTELADTAGLRRAAAFAVISRVYAMWASGTENEGFLRKSLFYRQLYEKARQRCRLGVDLGSDGIADAMRLGGTIRLVRD